MIDLNVMEALLRERYDLSFRVSRFHGLRERKPFITISQNQAIVAGEEETINFFDVRLEMVAEDSLFWENWQEQRKGNNATKILCTEELSCTLAALVNPPLLPIT